jgi:hypothetical protein
MSAFCVGKLTGELVDHPHENQGVINLGPVTKEQIERVRSGVWNRFSRPVDHPKPVSQVDVNPDVLHDRMIEAGIIPAPQVTPEITAEVQTLVEARGTATVTAILTAYVDVGTLPSHKAEALIERMKDQWKPAFQRLPDHVAVVYVPVRNQPTRFEMMVLPGK